MGNLSFWAIMDFLGIWCCNHYVGTCLKDHRSSIRGMDDIRKSRNHHDSALRSRKTVAALHRFYLLFFFDMPSSSQLSSCHIYLWLIWMAMFDDFDGEHDSSQPWLFDGSLPHMAGVDLAEWVPIMWRWYCARVGPQFILFVSWKFHDDHLEFRVWACSWMSGLSW